LIESASESVSKNATVIKTHHNDSQLVRVLRSQGRIVEPLSDYHKVKKKFFKKRKYSISCPSNVFLTQDEVRELGLQLGLPSELVWRQPFPGPGLAIRIICALEPFLTPTFDEVNARLAQYVPEGISATLLPVRTVGVQGDGRSYNHIVALSSAHKPDWEQLLSLTKSIPREVCFVGLFVLMQSIVLFLNRFFDGESILCHSILFHFHFHFFLFFFVRPFSLTLEFVVCVASLIQFHVINRAVFVVGEPLVGPFKTITPTQLTPQVISQLQHADDIVNHTLIKHNLVKKLSQVTIFPCPMRSVDV
jgi:GMP synthase PP-ATPase subunit